MSHVDVAADPASDDATNSAPLSSLLTECLRLDACRYAMSSELTAARVRSWLRRTRTPTKTPIWLWWTWTAGREPRHVQLNIQALQRHAPATHFSINKVNASRLAQLIDLPAEFPRLHAAAIESDIARIGLLAKYGGFYIDGDVLVAQSLLGVLDHLNEHEHVVYASPTQDCNSGVFSSNFIASRPNTTLWQRSWHSLREQLGSTCGGIARRKVCCYDNKRRPVPCRTPWGLTDRIVRPVAMELAGTFALSFHCLSGLRQGLTPMAYTPQSRFTVTEGTCLNWLHIYTAALNVSAGLHSRSTGDFACGKCISQHPRNGPNSTLCCRRRASHLECRNPRGHRTTSTNFFTRLAYHLFDSINGPTFSQHREIENSNLAIAALYRRALSLGPW